MDINLLITTANKHSNLTDFRKKSLELDKFALDINTCAKEKMSAFEEYYKKTIDKSNNYGEKIKEANINDLYNLIGIIDTCIDTYVMMEYSKKDTNKYFACIGLLSNSIKILYEINSLALNGFADGAFARWRSLYENFIIIKLLIKLDEETSNLFIKYQTVIKAKRIKDFNKLSTFDANEDLHIIINEYEELKTKYTEEFTLFNGWLYKKFPKKEDRAFTKLSEYVGNSEWLFPYRMACDYMHCNSFSAFESIGKVNGQFPMGPSENGLAFPIGLTINIAIYICVNLTDEFVGINYIGIFIHKYLLKILDTINKK
jgi:hypothetical protein